MPTYNWGTEGEPPRNPRDLDEARGQGDSRDRIVTVNGREYIRIGDTGSPEVYMQDAGQGDILQDPRWGTLMSMDMAERIDPGDADAYLAFALASAGLAAFIGPAIAAGAVAEGGAVAGGATAIEGGAAAGGAISGGGTVAGSAGSLSAADIAGLTQMGADAGLQGTALQSFVQSGGTLGSLSAGGGGVQAMQSVLTEMGATPAQAQQIVNNPSLLEQLSNAPASTFQNMASSGMDWGKIIGAGGSLLSNFLGSQNAGSNAANAAAMADPFAGQRAQYQGRLPGMVDRFNQQSQNFVQDARQFDRQYQQQYNQFDRQYNREYNQFERQYQNQNQNFVRDYERERNQFDQGYQREYNQFENQYNRERNQFDRGYANEYNQFSDRYASQYDDFRGTLDQMFEDPNYWAENSLLSGMNRNTVNDTSREMAARGYNMSGNEQMEIAQRLQNNNAQFAGQQQQNYTNYAGQFLNNLGTTGVNQLNSYANTGLGSLNSLGTTGVNRLNSYANAGLGSLNSFGTNRLGALNDFSDTGISRLNNLSQTGLGQLNNFSTTGLNQQSNYLNYLNGQLGAVNTVGNFAGANVSDPAKAGYLWQQGMNQQQAMYNNMFGNAGVLIDQFFGSGSGSGSGSLGGATASAAAYG